MRRFRHSKYYVQTKIGDEVIFICKTDDLTDEELQQHYNLAIARDDFEYASEIAAEAKSRNFKLKHAVD